MSRGVLTTLSGQLRKGGMEMNVYLRTRLRRAVLAGMLTTLSAAGAASGADAATVAPSACGTSGTAAPAPRVIGGTLDTRFTDAWRQFGNSGGGWADRRGWGASDGMYSTDLPGHRVVWLLNDTFMGPVNADESMPLDNAFVHNSAV